MSSAVGKRLAAVHCSLAGLLLSQGLKPGKPSLPAVDHDMQKWMAAD